MAELRVEAFVFRMVDYRDSDRILTLYSRELGPLDVLARGARKSFRRFGGHLAMFGRVEALVDHREGRSLSALRSARMLDGYPAFQQDLVRFAIASYLAEIVLRTAAPGAPDDEVWGLLCAAFSSLAHGSRGDREDLVRVFELHILRALGVLPDLSCCSRCGADLAAEGAPAYAPRAGDGLFCARCRPHDRRSELLSPLTRSVLLRALDAPVPAEPSGDFTRDVSSESGALTGELLRSVVGGSLRSAEFLRQMLG